MGANMVLKFLTGVSIFLAMASAPVSLARYTPDQEARVVKASLHTGSSTHHLLELVSTIARPEPILAVGATVHSQEGLRVGKIEDILIDGDIIQALLAMPEKAAVTRAVYSGAAGPHMLLIPASAFDTRSGSLVLNIPLEQLSRMARTPQ